MFKKFTTRELVFLSLMISLNVILTRVASIRIAYGGIEGFRIGFGSFPTILAGILVGPIGGGIVGGLGDAIGYYINPMGPFVPHFSLSAALTGVLPALVLLPVRGSTPKYWQLFGAIALGQISTSIILTPYLLQEIFAIPMFATLPGRILSLLVEIPVYTGLMQILLRRLPIQAVLPGSR